ncbi:unnamed protein product [Closterium sp. NIES-53]
MATTSNALAGHHGLRLGRLHKDQTASLLSLRHDRKASFPGSGKMQASSSRCLRLVATATVQQSQASSAQSPASLAVKEDAPINFDDLGFGLVETDYMYVAKCVRGEEWQQGELRPYGNLEISPAAGVLNYGQGVFEGMKAYRTADGRVLLFRPRENALRMQESADRLSMPGPPVEQFVQAVKDTVLANLRWVSEGEGGGLGRAETTAGRESVWYAGRHTDGLSVGVLGVITDAGERGSTQHARPPVEQFVQAVKDTVLANLRWVSEGEVEIGCRGIGKDQGRMQESADRLSMPGPPVKQFVQAVKGTVLANLRWLSERGLGRAGEAAGGENAWYAGGHTDRCVCPPLPVGQFVQAVDDTVLGNLRWVAKKRGATEKRESIRSMGHAGEH